MLVHKVFLLSSCKAQLEGRAETCVFIQHSIAVSHKNSDERKTNEIQSTSQISQITQTPTGTFCWLIPTPGRIKLTNTAFLSYFCHIGVTPPKGGPATLQPRSLVFTQSQAAQFPPGPPPAVGPVWLCHWGVP